MNRNYFTDYGKKTMKMVAEYPLVKSYYDPTTGVAIIPLSEFNESEELRSQVGGLLKTKKFFNSRDTLVNWALEICSLPDQEGILDEEVDYVCIRDVESF